MIFQRKVTGLLFLAGLALQGCGGNGAKVDGAEVLVEDPANGLTAEPADELIRSSLLRHYTSADNGMGDGGADSSDEGSLTVSESAAPIADSAADTSGIGATRTFSDTNVQEAGVDESDRIKIDGDVLYALETPDFNYINYVEPLPENFLTDDVYLPYEPLVETLSAYRLDGDNSSVISRLQLHELSDRSISGMYLYKSNEETDLILLSGQSYYPWDSWGRASAFGGLETRISWVDASDPSALSTQRTMDIQGHLISSRRVDNRLILVTRFYPEIDGVISGAYAQEDIDNNRSLITNAEASEFMPVVSVTEDGDSSQRPVIGDNLCYSSTLTGQGADNSAADSSYYYPSPSIISIISVDLDNLSTGINSACFVGDSETLYVSTESVYLATTQYDYPDFADGGVATGTPDDATVVDGTSALEDSYYAPEIRTNIHKFTFSGTGAPVFRGSGSVKGHLGWNPERKPYRLSEKDNNLRVVTFDETLQQSPVTLSILKESGGRLTAISTLPNESRPAPIGKPEESLYASRFIGDKAYLVTFRITDPLYVLDLSNPNDPRIAGELEIPGYSDYLHAVNDSLLIGLGKDAVEATTGFGGWEWERGAFYQGVKLSLYDVADPTNPFVADERIYGKRGTESPALRQPHSFTFLNGSGDRNFRLAIPLSLADGTTFSAQQFAPWKSNNLLSLEVDENSNRFVDLPQWEMESVSAGFRYSPVGLENDRAVIGSDDELYLIHNGTLHYGDWGSSQPSLSVRN